MPPPTPPILLIPMCNQAQAQLLVSFLHASLSAPPSTSPATFQVQVPSSCHLSGGLLNSLAPNFSPFSPSPAQQPERAFWSTMRPCPSSAEIFNASLGPEDEVQIPAAQVLLTGPPCNPPVRLWVPHSPSSNAAEHSPPLSCSCTCHVHQ